MEVDDETHALAKAAAAIAGVTLTEWVDRTLDEAARKKLAERADQQRRR